LSENVQACFFVDVAPKKIMTLQGWLLDSARNKLHNLGSARLWVNKQSFQVRQYVPDCQFVGLALRAICPTYGKHWGLRS
jgi:hypothetical protein